jgi:uncharacterized repeat protein (TIGR01451 family)/PGF-CTERM protein
MRTDKVRRNECNTAKNQNAFILSGSVLSTGSVNKKIKRGGVEMSNENNQNGLRDCLMNRIVVVSVLVAFFVMVGLASPAIAQASTDVVLILHFDEGSGTIVKDESGHGNDGTIYGATWVDGKYGKALSFDGKDDYVNLGSAVNFGDGDLTIEAWIKIVGDSHKYYHTIISDDYGKTILYSLGVRDSNGHPYTYFRDNKNDFVNPEGSVSLKDNKWHHIVAVRDGTSAYLYIDGSVVDSDENANLGAIDSGHSDWIGYKPDNNGAFNGIIDEVHIYNRALTTDEIKAHYEGKEPELTLTKSASPSTIQEGETTTISIRIENTGTGDAKSIEVTDTIPTGFKIISGSKSASFDTIKPGDYRTSEYTLKATGSGKFTCDPATATYEDADGNSYSAASNSVSIQVGGEVPVGADSDGDGWSDEKEREMGTNPYSVDSDGDGLKDPEDPNPTVPEEKKTPGFEVVFAIAGLLAVAYLVKGKKVK